jgi:thiamine-monophosphate kinase
VISVTAIGLKMKKKLLKEMVQNQMIFWCTGDLGGAYLGLQILEREHSVYLANPICNLKWKVMIIF